MSQTKKLTPNLDQQSTKMLNLTVLQRRDPCIEEILFTASHVSFYSFNIESNQWSRKDVEGSLFVVKRNAEPQFQFIVMNRRNADNLVENLLDFEYELKKPYLLYRNAAQEVNGIWFYNSDESEEVANLFNGILDAYSKAAPKTKLPYSKSEFEELEPVAIVTEKNLKKSSATPSAIGSFEDAAFVDCLNTDKVAGNYPSNVDSLRQPYHSGIVASVAPSGVFSASPIMNVPSGSHSASLLPAFLRNSSDTSNRGSQNASLLKPSTLVAPTLSPSAPSAAFLNFLNQPQPRQHGTPLLQPFPPPSPPPSLNPTCTSASNKPIIRRERVRDALSSLVQDDQFIDLVFQTLLKPHH
ncbi:mRNA-decapping enzyme-like protein [Prosopis cineraria]|uniref:mRNA-decapping enzyme-like protein n=1 Tax=Prosopis cineraria TaxID=364024 RepID=UPI0024108F03|nr:mRNA-decapping enzyme-like protein [Prosopis cineraria]